MLKTLTFRKKSSLGWGMGQGEAKTQHIHAGRIISGKKKLSAIFYHEVKILSWYQEILIQEFELSH